jgi:hypothetical protein
MGAQQRKQRDCGEKACRRAEADDAKYMPLPCCDATRKVAAAPSY